MSDGGLRGTQRRRWLLAIVPAAAVAAGALWALRDTTPLLIAADLEAARERWRRGGPPDYTLRLLKLIDSQKPERVVTEVRSGRAVRLLVGGVEVPASESYSVPGLFQTAERELELAASQDAAPGQPRGVVLRARFDEATGAPLVLKRLAAEGASYVMQVEGLEIPGKERP